MEKGAKMGKITIQCNSSAILRAEYYSDGKLFLQMFDKSQYCYHDVPQELIEEFIRADSKGGFFNRYIRNCFTYTDMRNETTEIR